MSDHDTTNQPPEPLIDFFVPDQEKIRLLQTIIEAESGNPVTYEYAEEVGLQLIGLYECLSRDRTIVGGDRHEQHR